MLVVNFFRALRPRQWSKNAVIFIGLIFALKLRQVDMLLATCGAFLLFCLLSGGVYLVNDLVDVERDRLHPVKRTRPIASGALPRGVAIAAAIAIPAVCLPISFLIGHLFGPPAVISYPGAMRGLPLEQPVSFVASHLFGITASAYYLLNIAYCFWLKNIVIIDVFSIAAGFVLRVVAGAVVINVPVSPWLYLCTILGALFLGFSKRRHELTSLAGEASEHRSILEEYSPVLLDQMIAIVTASLIMAYSLYTFYADNLPKNHAMMLTIPFALYGIFRYLYLVHQRQSGGSPEEVLLKEWPIIADIIAWGATAVAVLYFFRD
jgi:4-hydroxybenzoate polyprenyltransferase